MCISIKTMSNKKTLGQFFTKNYEKIFSGITIPKDTKKIIEPFAGDCDLIKFIDDINISIDKYDIDPKNDTTVERDTLLDPPDYTNYFILTNPPYLARNKSTNKEIFDLYKENDLYKCFLRILITNKSVGGLIIIPLNFFTSIRNIDIKLRKDFLYIYRIKRLNIFTKKVFSDTSYSVCSFIFVNKSLDDFEDIFENLKIQEDKSYTIDTYILPENKNLQLIFSSKNDYTIGGEIYKLQKSTEYRVFRLTEDMENSDCITNILLKALDDNGDFSDTKKSINLSIVKDDSIFYGKNTSRTYASLVIEPQISLEKQEEIVLSFNNFMTEKRELYDSLFLTNYREGKRKRISFDLAYDIVKHLLL